MNRNLEGQQLFNIVVGLLILAVVVNLLWVNWSLLRAAKSATLPPNCDLACLAAESKKIISVEFAKMALPTPEPVTTTIAPCDEECVNKIVDLRLAKTPPSVVSQSMSTPTPAKSPTTSFYNLSGGTAGATDWTAVDDSFWLDTSLYGSNVSVTLEGWLKLQDSNGLGFVRLYDMTNNREVDSSQLQGNSAQGASFYSTPLSIWRGMNQYRIEVKSTTGYPVTIYSARLKIVSQ